MMMYTIRHPVSQFRRHPRPADPSFSDYAVAAGIASAMVEAVEAKQRRLGRDSREKVNSQCSPASSVLPPQPTKQRSIPPSFAAAVPPSVPQDRATTDNREQRTERPVARVDDNDKRFVVTLDLPGYRPDGVKVTVEPETDQSGNILNGSTILAVAGARNNRLYDVSFRKRFRVRDARLDMGRMVAEMTDGLLTIVLPKKAEQQRRVIAIRTTAPADESSGSKDGTMTDSTDVQHSDAVAASNGSVASAAEAETANDNESDDEEYAVIHAYDDDDDDEEEVDA